MLLRNLFILFLVALLGAMLPSFAFAEGDPVVFALSSRDGEPARADLEKIAGGADALVAKLLEIRTDDGVPFAAVRAEKILLSYADRSDVQSALEADVSSNQTKGLARVIAVHLDKAPTSDSRQALARAVLSRASSESDFVPYAKSLLQSSDSQVNRLARESLQ